MSPHGCSYTERADESVSTSPYAESKASSRCRPAHPRASRIHFAGSFPQQGSERPQWGCRWLSQRQSCHCVAASSSRDLKSGARFSWFSDNLFSPVAILVVCPLAAVDVGGPRNSSLHTCRVQNRNEIPDLKPGLRGFSACAYDHSFTCSPMRKRL